MKKGNILINRSVCDDAKECSGADVCATGALYWDESKKEGERLSYNAELCTQCEECVDLDNGCPLAGEALFYVKTEEEYAKVEEKIKNEKRTFADLKVERYGAEPIAEPISIAELKDWCKEQNENSVLLVELLNDNSIKCLLHSIRIKDIQDNIIEDSKHIKVFLDSNECFTDIEIEDLPTLLIYKNNKLLGKIDGYFDDSQEDLFFEMMREHIQE